MLPPVTPETKGVGGSGQRSHVNAIATRYKLFFSRIFLATCNRLRSVGATSG
jgi:hypothetical protein